MIKEFNISTSARANIFGEHYAAMLYAHDVVLHPDDVEYGTIVCDDLVVGQKIPPYEDLAYDDRVYKGVLHCRNVIIRGQDESTETDV